MSPKEIADESRALWESSFSEMGWQSLYMAGFPGLLSKKEREARGEVRRNLQPWLQILEDSIQWLMMVVLTLEERNTNKGLSDGELSVLVSIGASCSHAVAVRKLVLAGLDGPARATARSLDEHLCAALTFLHDRQLGNAFKQCVTDDEVSEFWFKNLNTRALKKHLNQIERKIGLPAAMSEKLRDWRDDEIKDFSKSLHPSYIGAALSTITFSAQDPKCTGLAILGCASCHSERTLRFACRSINFFSLYGLREVFALDGSLCPITPFEKENVKHRFSIIGANVLQSLNLKYWSFQIYSDYDDYE